MVRRANLFRVNLLDIASIVTAAAIAAVHVRHSIPAPSSGPTWIWAAFLLGWLTLTIAGPFFYFVRRCRPDPAIDYPELGDRLWGIWGCPWIISGIIESVAEQPSLPLNQLDSVYVGSLGIGLFLATMIAVPVLAGYYLWGRTASSRGGARANWTQWVGLGLSATWPLQCGVGLVLMG